jgi:FAD-dependent oxidoreductase domain-containing protein 1
MTANMLKEKFPWLNTDGIAIGCYGKIIMRLFLISFEFLGVQNEGWLDPWALLNAFRQKALSLGVLYLNGLCV